MVIFDLKSAHWTQPEVRGPIPKGRARHAAVVYDDKLFILGGLTGAETCTLDEICYLDLKTWTWSRSWSFVGRYDHTAWVWGGRMWVFGGLGPDMEKTGELWWLDIRNSPAFKTTPDLGNAEQPQPTIRAGPSSRSPVVHFNVVAMGSTGYTANSSSVQVRTTSVTPKPVAPGAISSMKFVSGPHIPSQASGKHFHLYSSGSLLDFATPSSTIRPSDCSLSALELDSLQWQKLAEGIEIFDYSFRWQYCAMNEDGTKAWLLGCRSESPDDGTGVFEEYLSDILPLDLRRFGLLGNELAPEPIADKTKAPTSERHTLSPVNALGMELARMFDQPPESGCGSDFIVTGEQDDPTIDDPMTISSSQQTLGSQDFLPHDVPTSAPIHVHKLILQARWPHFTRVYAAQMAEFHTKKMHIPEPYSVVRAFLYYLYTDSIAHHPEYCSSLGDVAGLLVMANIYDMPTLRLLCIHRLSRELDVESAATVWERANVAGEDWLRRRAATFCLTHWGRLVRTEGFRKLSRQSLMELCEVIDVEGRVVSGEELEVVGGLGGGKVGVGGSGRSVAKSRSPLPGLHAGDEMEDVELTEDEGMELN